VVSSTTDTKAVRLLMRIAATVRRVGGGVCTVSSLRCYGNSRSLIIKSQQDQRGQSDKCTASRLDIQLPSIRSRQTTITRDLSTPIPYPVSRIPICRQQVFCLDAESADVRFGCRFDSTVANSVSDLLVSTGFCLMLH
jgi:hypothetical protein